MVETTILVVSGKKLTVPRILKRSLQIASAVALTAAVFLVVIVGNGLLVGRQDPAAIASALDRMFTEPGLSARMSSHAADLAPQLLWPAVALSYRELAAALTRTPAGATL